MQQALHSVRHVLWQTLSTCLAGDRYAVAMTVVFALLFVPLIPRATENAQKLAAFVNDEPALTMALEAMTARPYGNPGNFYGQEGAKRTLPEHWGSIRYGGFTYYGGTYLGLGFVLFAPLHALGLPTFPTAPIILRATSTLAGYLSLLLLYNVAKRLSGVAGGLLVVLVVMTDNFFIYYTSIIHPDTVQLCLGLLAWLLAARHAHDGQPASLLTLGLLCGLVQGTKAGGPWLAPMALLAVYWGLQQEADSTHTWTRMAQRYARRLCALGAVALLAYVVSTPYAFLDRQYFATLRAVWKLVSKGPLGEVNFFTWLQALRAYWGDGPLLLTLLALLWIVLQTCRGTRDVTLCLAGVLAVSQLLWFGNTGSLWVVLGYLLVAFSLGAVLIVDMAAQALRWLWGTGQWLRWLAPTVAVLGGMLVVESRWFTLANAVLMQHVLERSTTVEIGRWAERAGIPQASRIVYDDTAYFHPQRFPHSHMHGGALTWSALKTLHPDIVVLSSSIYDAPWYAELRRTQHLSREDTYAFSMRLYQVW